MANKATLTDGHILTDEGVRLNFAVVTNAGIALDLNKRADEHAVAEHAVIKIGGFVKGDIFTTGYVAYPGWFTIHRLPPYIKHN